MPGLALLGGILLLGLPGLSRTTPQIAGELVEPAIALDGYLADFSNSSGRGVGVRFVHEATGKYVDLRLKGVEGKEPVARDRTREFSAAPGVRVVYEPNGRLVKETIVLDQASPSELRFQIKTNGLTPRTEGGHILLGNADHPARFQFHPVEAWDSVGTSIPGSLSLGDGILEDGSRELILTLDPEVLAQARPPIVIDPTIEGAPIGSTAGSHARRVFQTADGRGLFFYAHPSGGTFSISYQISEDGGDTWDSTTTVTSVSGTTELGAHQRRISHIDPGTGAEVFEDSFYLAYSTADAIVFRALTPSGTSWTVGSPVTVASGGVTSGPAPSIVHRGTGALGTKLAVGFTRYNAVLDKYDYLVSFSEDSGATWLPPVVCAADSWRGAMAQLGERTLCLTGPASHVGIEWREWNGALFANPTTIAVGSLDDMASTVTGYDGKFHLTAGKGNVYYTSLTGTDSNFSTPVFVGTGQEPVIAATEPSLNIYATDPVYNRGRESYVRRYISSDGSTWSALEPLSGRPFTEVLDYNSAWAFESFPGDALFGLSDSLGTVGNVIGTKSFNHRLDDPDEKLDFRFTAPASGGTVSKIELWATSSNNAPKYRIGLQTDCGCTPSQGPGYASGTWVNEVRVGGVLVGGSFEEVSFATGIDDFVEVDFGEVTATANSVYHVVVEAVPDPTGLIGPATTRWSQFQAVGSLQGIDGDADRLGVFDGTASGASTTWTWRQDRAGRFVVSGSGGIVASQKTLPGVDRAATEYAVTGESFVAPRAIAPTTARLYLEKQGNPTTPVTLRLIDTTGANLWSQQVTPTASGWITSPVSGVSLNVGTRYRFLADSTNRDYQNYWLVGVSGDASASWDGATSIVALAYDRPGFNERSAEAADFRTWPKDLAAFNSSSSDALYLGDSQPFDYSVITRLAGSNGATVGTVLKYWNGTSWADLSTSNNSLGQSGGGDVEFTIPTDWVTNAVDGRTAYWVKVTASSGAPTDVLIDRISSIHNYLEPSAAPISGGGIPIVFSSNSANSAAQKVKGGGQTTYKIGDFLWGDLDNDGERDAAESGLGGITVKLRAAGSNGVFEDTDTVYSATTGNNNNNRGKYTFTNLAPGSYRVEIDHTQTGLIGKIPTTTNLPHVVTIATSDYLTADFGFAIPPNRSDLAIDVAQVTTFAGTGTSATTDGTATGASFTSLGGGVKVGKYLFVSTSGAIRRVDTTNGAVTTLKSDPAFTGGAMATDGYFLYTLNGSGTVVVRKTSLATGATISITPSGIWGLRGITYFVGDSHLYLTTGQSIYKMNTDGGNYQWANSSNGLVNNYAITSDDTYLWVAAQDGNTYGKRIDRVKVADKNMWTLTTSGETGSSSIGLNALELAGNYLYGTGAGDGIRRYDKDTGAAVNIAGVNVAGYLDGTGTDAWFNNVRGIASDGNALWIADSSNFRVRKAVLGTALPASQPTANLSLNISPAFVTTAAGDGQQETRDGLGVAARFSGLYGMRIIGGFGYVSTQGSIRKVNLTSGEVTTLAGSGTSTGITDSTNPLNVRFTSGDMATDGYFLYTLSGTTVRRTSISNGATSTIATIPGATSITYGPDGFLYVSTAGSTMRVMKLDPVGGSYSEFASLHTITGDHVGFMGAITADANHLYVSLLDDDPCSGTCQAFYIKKVNFPTETVSTVTVTDFASSGGLWGSMDIGALESAGGYLYGTANYGNTIRRYAKANASYIDIAGTYNQGYQDGVGTDAWLYNVQAIASDGTNLWVADHGNMRLRKAVATTPLPARQSPGATKTLEINPAAVATFAGNGASAEVNGAPLDTSFDSLGDVSIVGTDAYVASTGYIRKVNLATGETTALAGNGLVGCCANGLDPAQVQFGGVNAMTSDGYYLYTVNRNYPFSEPVIRRTSLATGATSIIRQLWRAGDITFAPDGMLYLGGHDPNDNTAIVYRLNPITAGYSTFKTLSAPAAGPITSDATHVWVATDPTGNAIVLNKIALNDTSMDSFTTSLTSISDIESAGDYLYLSDSTNVYRFHKQNGTLVGIAGSGTSGYSDGIGSQAAFSGIAGLASDGNHVWVADSNNRFLRVASKEFFVGLGGYGYGDGYGAPWGNFEESTTDLEIATPGPDLELTRSYNSYDPRIGSLGKGWTHNYEMTWEPIGIGGIAILYPDGRREVHTKDASGVFKPPVGYFSKLEPDGTGYKLTLKDRTVYRFNSSKRLTSITDSNDRSVTLNHDGAGRLISVSDSSSGRSLTIAWNGERIDSVSTGSVSAQGGPLTWKYYYSGELLDKACDPRNNASTGTCTVYNYTGGRLTKITRPKGNVGVEVGYQTDGRVDFTNNGVGDTTDHSYSASGEARITDPRGVATPAVPNDYTTVHNYDGKFRETKLTDPVGLANNPVKFTLYEYDSAGNRSKVTDTVGAVSLMGYDTNGNLTTQTVTDANGSEVTPFTYDANDNLTKKRDPRTTSDADDTFATTYQYDSSGNRTRETLPAVGGTQAIKEWTYYAGTEAAIEGGTVPKGLLKTETNPLAGITTYRYDSKGNLREVEDPAGLLTTYTYDEIGRKLTEIVADSVAGTSATTSYAYNVLGNVLTVTGPQVQNQVTLTSHRQRTRNEYDLNVNLVTQTVEDLVGGDASRVTVFTYDLADRQTSVTDPEGGVLTRRHDAAGNVDQVTDQEGRIIETLHSSRNLPERVTVKGYLEDSVAGGGVPRDFIQSQFEYDLAGRKTAEIDALGRRREFTYDRGDRLKSSALKNFDNLSGSLRDIMLEEYVYDLAGNLLTETKGAALQVLSHAYDAIGRRQTTTLDPGDPAQGKLNRLTVFGYDPMGNVVTETSCSAISAGTCAGAARTEMTTFAYDTSGRRIEQTVENGAVDLKTYFAYDERGNLIREADPRSAVPTDTTYATDHEYDELSRLVKTTSPSVPVEENGGTPTDQRPTVMKGYNTYGDLSHEKDPRGFVTSKSYDRLGRNTLITHPTYTQPIQGGATLTPTEAYSYDKVGNLRFSTDRRGKTTEYRFDTLNRPTRQIDPQVTGETQRGTTSYSYDDKGSRTSVTDQRGARTEWTYDDLDRTRKEIQLLRDNVPAGCVSGCVTTFDYDDLGNQILIKDPLGNETLRTFSPASELIEERDPLAQVTKFTYDLASRPVTTLDPLNRKTENTHDLAGRLTAIKRYAPGVTTPLTTESFTYDAAGNQLTATSPRGFATSFTYDALNRLTGVVEPVSEGTTIPTFYGYDAASNLTRATNGKGIATIYTYNPFNLPEKTIEPSTTAHPNLDQRTLTTIYDGGGLPVKELQPGGVTIDRTFDQLGRLTQESGAGDGSAQRTFGYDLAGLRTKAGHPGGEITFNYEDRGLLTGNSGGGVTATSYTYDAAGRMRTRNDPAGSHSFEYSARGELITASDPLSATTSTYTYDASGQLDFIRLGSLSYPKREVAFDDLGRLTSDVLLTSATTSTASMSYGYDPDGNVTQTVVSLPGNPQNGTHSFSYDFAGRIKSHTRPDNTNVPYAFDGAGNRILAGTDPYLYDDRNRLIEGPTGMLYSHTPRGTVSSVTNTQTQEVIDFTFDSLSRLTVYDNQVTYTYDAMDRIATRTEGAQTSFAYSGFSLDPATEGNFRYSRTPGGRLLGLRKGTDPALLAGLNRHGDLSYLSDPAGAISDTAFYDPFGVVIGATGTTNPTLGFQGDYTDPISDKVWMGARWYGATEANFLSRDSVFGMLRTPISLNRYTYAGANPLKYFDPDGRAFCIFHGWANCRREGRKLYHRTTRAVGQVGRSFRAGMDRIGSAASEGRRTLRIQATRAQQRIKRVVVETHRAAGRGVARFTQARRDVSDLITGGAGYVNLAREFFNPVANAKEFYASMEEAGGNAVDEYIAATGHIPVDDNMLLFNLAVNPIYRALDKCTGGVTEQSWLGCAGAVVETAGIAFTGAQAARIGVKGFRVAGTASRASLHGGETLLDDLTRAPKTVGSLTSRQRAQYLFDNWSPGTFENRTRSIAHHLERHGGGRSAYEYTRDAMQFFVENRSLGSPGVLKNGAPGIRIQTKQPLPGGGTRNVGGWWTEDGRLVTFWD